MELVCRERSVEVMASERHSSRIVNHECCFCSPSSVKSQVQADKYLRVLSLFTISAQTFRVVKDHELDYLCLLARILLLPTRDFPVLSVSASRLFLFRVCCSCLEQTKTPEARGEAVTITNLASRLTIRAPLRCGGIC